MEIDEEQKDEIANNDHAVDINEEGMYRRGDFEDRNNYEINDGDKTMKKNKIIIVINI